MYGLITRFTTRPDRRDLLIRILAAGTTTMPGCPSDVIAEDPARDDTIRVTEVRTDRDAHAASLRLRAVRDAVARGRSMVTGIGRGPRPVRSASFHSLARNSRIAGVSTPTGAASWP